MTARLLGYSAFRSVYPPARENNHMRTCESCGRVRFYSLNFLFSKTVCNECYLSAKEREKKRH